MPKIDESLKQELLESDPKFRALFEQHQDAERRLEEINQKTLLAEEDELEEKKIKRHKLFLKDSMETILREHRDAGVPA